MRVFQDRYRGADGVTRAVKCWSIELTDHLGMTRQIATGQRDKRTAEAIGRNLERLIRCRVSGEPLDPVTAKWLEGISPKLRTTLEKFGLLDAARMAALRPLVEHVLGTADEPGWKQYIASKGSVAVHVERYPKMVLRALAGSGAVYWSDISATRLMAWLNEQRIAKPDARKKCERRGLSICTFNGFVAALKCFGKWMQREGRASDTPMEILRKLNAKTDKRHERRPLDIDELHWLLDTTRKGPARAGMTGPERAMLYRLAVETGLRSSELASLTRSSFRLDGPIPTVTVQASYSKRRRDDVLPLRPNTAADLREFFANKPPLAKAFNMPPYAVARELFRPDLNAARQAWLNDADTTSPSEPGESGTTGEPGKPDEQRRCEATPSGQTVPDEQTTPAAPSEERQRREASSFLCYLDAQGRYADFHALRHTTGTLLAASGVTPKTAQTLMRHCDINLTMSLYTHTLAGQEAAAIAMLPNFTTASTKQPTTPANTNPTRKPEKLTAATTTQPPAAPTAPTAADTTPTPATTPTTPTETPAKTADIPTNPDTGPAKIDEKTTPENPPNTQPENSPENSPNTCTSFGLCSAQHHPPAVLAENSKKDENIVKIENFPVKSDMTTLGTELPKKKHEIRNKSQTTNRKTQTAKPRHTP